MKCPSCGSHGFGVDCPRCAAPFPDRSCPACQRPFLSCDRFCRGCGRELRFVNFSNHPILRRPVGLTVQEYEYPSDRAARQTMATLWPIQILARYGVKKLAEDALVTQLLGSCVKVTDRQFPQIKRVGDVCKRYLNVANAEIFISNNQAPSATTYGSSGTAYVILTSGLVETMDEGELLFVVGHELGHVKSDHILYLVLIRLLQRGVLHIPMFGNAVQEVLGLVLTPWQRNSEITADRAGLICCQSLQTATKALTKLAALGSRALFERIDLDEFLRQYQDLKQQGSWDEYLQVHPFVLTRIRMIQAFLESTSWFRIMSHASHPHRPRLTCPYCAASCDLADPEARLFDLLCPGCGKNLHVHELDCPHCGTLVPVDGTASLAGLSCPSCHHPGFLPGERAVADAWNHELPATAAYRLLDVPFTATPEDVAEAYAKAMRPPGGRALPTERKVALHRAYQALITTRRRMRHDQELERWVAEHLAGSAPGAAPPACPSCGVPSAGPFCGSCGASPESAGSSADAAAKRPGDVAQFAAALGSARSLGEGLETTSEPPFDVVARLGTRTLYVTFHRGDLTTPAAVRSLIAASHQRADALFKRSWLHASALFVALMAGNADEELVTRMITREFERRRGSSCTCTFMPVLQGPGGLLKRLPVPGAEGEPTTYQGFEELAAGLARLLSPDA